MKTVLITGVAGFIGSNLAQRCLKEGWNVWGVDDLSNGHVVFVPQELFDTKQFIYSDFTDKRILNYVKNGVFDYVFHLAAVPRVSYSVEHPIETNDVNVTKSLELLEACKGNIDKFIFASSSSVYGDVDVARVGPVRENFILRPKSPYALQKAIIEDYLRLYHNLYGLNYNCLRFFNVFGPGQLGNSAYATAVSAWLTALKSDQPLRFDGTGQQSRDMCYVDNVVDACVRAARGDTTHHSYNVACGSRITNSEILEMVMKHYTRSKSMITYAPSRPGDVMHTHADITNIQRDLGYAPLVRFEEGLQRTIKWYDENWHKIKHMKLKM